MEEEKIIGSFSGIYADHQKAKKFQKKWNCELVFSTDRLIILKEKGFKLDGITKKPPKFLFSRNSEEEHLNKKREVEERINEKGSVILPKNEIDLITMGTMIETPILSTLYNLLAPNQRVIRVYTDGDKKYPKHQVAIDIMPKFSESLEKTFFEAFPRSS